MRNIYSADFFEKLSPSPQSTDFTKLPTADGRGVIFLNRERKYHLVLSQPPLNEIEAVVASIERARLDTFWQNKVLAESIRFPGLIGAFAGWSDATPELSIPRGLILAEVYFPIFGESSGARAPHATERRAALFDRLREIGLERQRYAISKLPHGSLVEAQPIILNNAWCRFVKIPRIRPSHTKIKGPEEWISKFVSLLKLDAAPPNASKSYLLAIACALRARGRILLPTSTAAIAGRSSIKSLPEVSSAFSTKQQELLAELLKSVPAGSSSNVFAEAVRQARVVILSTSLEAPSDVTLEFANAACALISTPVHGAAPRGHVYRRLFEMAVANGTSAVEVAHEEQFIPVIKRYCEPRLADFRDWLDLLTAYRGDIHVQNILSVANQFRALFTVLAASKSVPKPTNYGSQDAARFVDYLARLGIKTRGKNLSLSRASHFFSWLQRREAVAGRTFNNPLDYGSLKKRPKRHESRQKAAAERIHSWILQELREHMVLHVEDGFTWSAFASQSTVRMNGEEVFCPILPAIIYFLIRYPLRSNQARYLDSGELDEICYDFHSKRFVENPTGIRGRRLGLLQPAEGIHRISDVHQVDFQVAINKRLLEEQDRAEYTIPWIDEETIWVIQQVVEWQKKYGAAPALVRISEGAEGKRTGYAQTKAAKHDQAQLCCLFRYPNSNGFWPPTYNQVARYWRKLGQLWDSKNSSWRDPATGTVGQRPHVATLTAYVEYEFTLRGRTYRRIEPRSKYGLHSLRVSGVSRLLDLGVPLGMVSSMAGHRGVALTLYYYRIDLPTLRAKLDQAQGVKHMVSTLDAVERRLRDLSASTDDLCGSKTAFGALERARANGGLISISLTGICPGTSCADGLEDHFKGGEGLPVPGSRCVFCRYRLFGPAFLEGLVQEYNHLLYGLREAGRRLMDLREKRMTAQEKGDHKLVAVLQAEDEELERQTEIDASHWARLHEMINQSYAKLQEQTKSGIPASLLVNNPDAKAAGIPRLSWQLVPDFDQETEILKTASILPSSKSTIPQQVMDRMQNRLVGFLVRNSLDPFLVRLPRQHKEKATLLLAEVIRNAVTDVDERSALLEGSIKLSSIPKAESAVEELGHALANTALVQALYSEIGPR